MIKIKRILLFCIVFIIVFVIKKEVYATEVMEKDTYQKELLELYDFSDINEQLEIVDISFEEIMETFLLGDFSKGIGLIKDSCMNALFGEVSVHRVAIVKIIILAIISSIFSNMSVILNRSEISETGFFITYISMLTILLGSFQICVGVIEDVTVNIMAFIKVLVPALVLSVGLCCGQVTAVGFGEIALFIIYIGEVVVQNFILPVIRFYVILMLVNQMLSEDYLSGFGELFKNIVTAALKIFTSVVLGLNIIKGMILPTIDIAEKYTAVKLINLIPGAETLTSAGGIVLNSAAIIKNAVGGAGIVALVILAAIPAVKLIIFISVYKLTAAFIQPIGDKRIIKSIHVVADGVNLLNKLLFTQVIMSSVSIALMCFITNKTGV